MTFDIRKIDEMENWLALDKDPAFIAGTPEYRYETRLAMADDLKARSVINAGEWRELLEEADAAYSDELG